MEKLPSKFLILVCLVIVAVGSFYMFRSQGQEVSAPSYAPPKARADVPQSVTLGAPDGKMTLTMREDKGKTDTTYTLSAKVEAGGSQAQIYSKTVPAGVVISIPFNTFSPDNKYLFLKETGRSQTSYFALRSSGAEVAKDAQTLNISSLFADKYPDYKITEATGWAAPTLVVINTTKSNGGMGPSFWFDVASKSFIQLSSHFN